MSNERQIHDTAVATLRSLMDVAAPLIDGEERRAAFAHEAYLRIAAGLRHFEIQAERERSRLHPIPSDN